MLAGAAEARAERVNVFAAASLKTALDGVSAAWKAETGHDTANTYAASSALARQIEAGAPADIFISADVDWMQYLSGRNLTVKDSEVKLLGNALVLVVPAGSTARLKIAPGFALDTLIGDGRLAVADVKAVPAGKYAKAALESLGVWPKLEARIAQAENVRAALKLVATGEAPAGIVYRTDAESEPQVKILDTFPEHTHPAITYPAAILSSSTTPAAAAFMDFLRSPTATEIFRTSGFEVLNGD
jgi:molybdate transport system substrate-binding protein